ncbi:MAG: hypothetical protein KatS3mg111_0132 [Pirellulaceae bacterium]|nr:MAG: hypothetical protein KatS3mg111_0132 [Pirellulaceae bacterium]
MSLTAIELYKRLTQLGLASEAECRQWAARCAQRLDAAHAVDGQAVLEALVDLGHITPYQAAKLSANADAAAFRCGSYLVLEPVASSVGEQWYVVRPADAAAPDQLKWARLITADELRQWRDSMPSLKRALQLAQARQTHLHPVEMPERTDAGIVLLMPPVGDRLLADQPLEAWFPDRHRRAELATQIVRQVGEGLAELHQRELVHGRVLPDRVTWNGTTARLITDPLCTFTLPIAHQTSGTLGTLVTQETLLRFCAPEFLAPGQRPTPATDVFSLGYLWWWLLYGTPPQQETDPQRILVDQTQPPPALPDHPALAPPLQRVLLHALARDPRSRFRDAAELVKALNYASELARTSSAVPSGRSRAVDEPDATAANKDRAPANRETSAGHEASVRPTNTDEVAGDKQVGREERRDKAKAKRRQESRVRRSPPPTSPRQPATTADRSQPPTEAAAVPAAPPKGRPASDAPPSPSAAQQNDDAENAKQGGTSVGAEPRAASAAHETDPDHRQASSPSSPRTGDTASHPGPPAPSAMAAGIEDTRASLPTESAKVLKTDKASASGRADHAAPGGVASPQPAEPAVEADTAASPAAGSKPLVVGQARSVDPAQPVPSPVRRRRKRKKPQWLLPVAGGCGFLIILLLVLKFSGALDSVAARKSSKPGDGAASNPTSVSTPRETVRPNPVRRDPREEMYRVVDEHPTALWLPPFAPDPLPLDLLPPGGQVFVHWHPRRLVSDAAFSSTLRPWQQEVDAWRSRLETQWGVSIDQVESSLLAIYPPGPTHNDYRLVWRIELIEAAPVEELANQWAAQSVGEASGTLRSFRTQRLTYLCQSDAEGRCQVFSLGPPDLMEESLRAGGGAGPLLGAVEALHQRTSTDFDCVVLGSAPFLLAESHSLLSALPPRMPPVIQQLLGREARGVLLQTRLTPEWYWEIQIAGAGSVDAGKLLGRLQDAITSWPAQVEQWLVRESPHPFWRPVALRFPQMLRVLADYCRFQVENGIAMVNAYLPSEAAANLLTATWIAAHETATYAGDMRVASASDPPSSNFTIDDYLARPIRVVFDQEPIEVALELIQEEANDRLPPGATPLRFQLDGDAFELAGITRNQQIRGFSIEGQPVRDALTELARRGNPVTTVQSTSDPEQRLIWVVKDDPQHPGRPMISLTTREAATAAGIDLPAEFTGAASTD